MLFELVQSRLALIILKWLSQPGRTLTCGAYTLWGLEIAGSSPARRSFRASVAKLEKAPGLWFDALLTCASWFSKNFSFFTLVSRSERAPTVRAYKLSDLKSGDRGFESRQPLFVRL